MARLIVLALDLGTTTGWCEGELGAHPVYGSVRLVGSSFGARFAALADFLQDRFESPAPPHQVVFEAPLPRTDAAGINAGRLGIGLASIVEYACHRYAIPCFESNTSRTRKQVTGRGGGWKSRDEGKRHVVDWCRANGFDPHDDNAADSIVLWKHTEQVRLPGVAASADGSRRRSWMVPA